MKRKSIVPVAALFTIISLIYSCSKIDTTALGGEVIPEIDNINTFETFLDVFTDNKLFDDSTRLYYSNYALGIIENDAEFGKTTAGIYASFRPNLYKIHPFIRRDSVIIDSIVLSLGSTTIYGDSNSVQHIEVREITPATNFKDSAYRLDIPDFPTEPNLLGSAEINFSTLNDSVYYRNGLDTVRSLGEMRIKLDTAWGRRFVNYDTTSGQPYYNDTLFREVFKGLEIKATETSPAKRALAYFDLNENTKSRVIFYLRRPKTTGAIDTTTAIFTYGGRVANPIHRTPANNYLANVNNSVDNDELLYIQSAPGSYATVKIEGLDTIANSLKVIHKAELVCESAASMDDFYAPPSALFIDAINQNNDSAFALRNDFVPTTSGSTGYEVSALGGTLSKGKYSFVLTRYVQSLVTYKFPNPLLRIYAPFTTEVNYYFPNSMIVDARYPYFVMVNPTVGYGRVILYGGAAADPSKKMKLRIIYSKI